MTTAPELWEVIKNHLPRDHFMSLDEIYLSVEQNVELDAGDYEPQSPSSDIPKWKRNVRNVLQYRKGTGEIEWDGEAGYKLSF